MGRGDTPAEQRRSILLATANAKAVQALRTADQKKIFLYRGLLLMQRFQKNGISIWGYLT